MNQSKQVKQRVNPFQCTDAEALQAYERSLQAYSKHAKEKIESYKNEPALKQVGE